MKVVTPSTGAHTRRRHLARCQATPSRKVDVVLSSGFLAFGGHCGFLQAVLDADLEVAGVMGTSSGALVGSLFAAGLTPLEILAEFASTKPIERIRLNSSPWRGIFNLSPAVERLSHLVPGDFADLETPLAVGVVSANGRQYAVINSGKLPEAVVASAAVPVLFAPVSIPGRAGTYIDGGIKSRVGLEAWRGIDRLHYPAAIHVVGRSSPFSGSSVVSSGESDGDQSGGEGGSEGEQDEGAADLADVVIVHSTRSKSSLWNLDESRLRAHFDASYEAARLELAASHDKLAR